MNDNYPIEAKRWNGDNSVPPITLTDEQLTVIGEVAAITAELGIGMLD